MKNERQPANDDPHTGEKRVLHVRTEMGGLDRLIAKYAPEQPLSGSRITGCVSVTYETANLITPLSRLGASVRWCPDNPGASKDDAVSYIASQGIPIFAKSDMDPEQLDNAYHQALNFEDDWCSIIGPNLLIDDGCDITRFVHKLRPELLENIYGVSEQTKCGINELRSMVKNGKLKIPAININDALTKTKFDNHFGIQESLITSLNYGANMQIRGKTIVIAGYGDVGKGCAEILSNLGGKVIVTEIDPLLAVEAELQGYTIMTMDQAARYADICITATGCNDVITIRQMRKMKPGVLLCNMGHGDKEINVPYLRNNALRTKINEHLDEYNLGDGKSVKVLCDGYLANMRIGSGNPPFMMSLTFTNHILAMIHLFNNPSAYERGKIYTQPLSTEHEVIELNFPRLTRNLTKLTKEQRSYLGIEGRP